LSNIGTVSFVEMWKSYPPGLWKIRCLSAWCV